MLKGPIKRGGPRFLTVFGSVLLLLWGVLFLAAGAGENALTNGKSGGGLDIVAILFWIAAITAMYVAFSESSIGQRAGVVISVLTLILGIAVTASAGWIFWWIFSGGLVGLATALSARTPSPSPNQFGPNPNQFGANPGQFGPNPGQFGPNPGQLGPNPGQLGPNPGQFGPNPGQPGPNPPGPNPPQF